MSQGTDILANRKFEHKNFVGAKTTWEFNSDGSKVKVKAGMFGINTVNSTIDVEIIGDGVFKGKGIISQKFKLENNSIRSGAVVLKEV